MTINTVNDALEVICTMPIKRRDRDEVCEFVASLPSLGTAAISAEQMRRAQALASA